MFWGNSNLIFLLLVSLVAADLCPEPMVPNGLVKKEMEKEPNLFFGEVTCNLGYHLVGARNIKCRHGVWSQEELPVCSVIRRCPSLPEMVNGRNIPIQGSRGSAYHFKCNRGFKRFGERRTHCLGDRWSHTHMPSCTKASCDETGMLDIPYGEGRAMMGGAVYKYRCNTGGEMEGSNTLVCNGEKWNGTIPDCNVGPSEPELELIVSGNVVTNVKADDVVLVTCKARGGNPIPDIGLTLEGEPSGSEEFKKFNNSFTFTAAEEDDGKRILCTASNKVRTSISSAILHVHTPPKTAAMSGPKTIHQNDSFTYECSVQGGNPSPKITWTVKDHLGQTKEKEGEMMAPGVSRMLLRTGAEGRMMSINCHGENSQGIVSHTMHVNTHYLPKTVEISGPTTAAPGEYAHFTCLTTESFPVPALKWRIEKSGNVHEVNDIDGDVSTEALEDGGVVAFAKIDILIEQGTTHAIVECSAVVEGLGEKSSIQHEIDVILIEEPIQILYTPSVETKDSDYSEEHYEASVDHKEEPIEIVSLENIPEFEEQERSKTSWIPLLPVEDIEDYQNEFASSYNEVNEDKETDHEEDFLRPSDIPEPKILKQEKEMKASVVNSPVSVSMDYSSSSPTVIQPILFAVALSLSMFFR